VHYNSGEEFTTTDYFLTHPDWSQDLVLASDDEDRIGPGLCWPGLAALLETPPGAAGVTDPHARLLLLLPVLGDAAVPEEAVTAVIEALIAQGVPEPSEALARELLQGHPMWGAEEWWFDDDEQSWLCEEPPYSPSRRPPAPTTANRTRSLPRSPPTASRCDDRRRAPAVAVEHRASPVPAPTPGQHT
jgi:hypothetical protein